MRVTRRAAWWILDIIVLVMAGLLVIEDRSPLPFRWQQAILAGIILLTYGLMALWLRLEWGTPDEDVLAGTDSGPSITGLPIIEEPRSEPEGEVAEPVEQPAGWMM
jgi:hypothetical protein